MHRSCLRVRIILLGAALLGLAVACQPEPDRTTVVDSFADAVDVDPGDGSCADGAGACTLRAAVMEANATSGIGQILLPAGTYSLTLSGAGENGGATGDLDLTDSTYIEVMGGVATIDAAGLGDRVIDIHGGTWHVLDGLRLVNGAVTGQGGALRASAGIVLATVEVAGNSATLSGGGIASVGGIVALEGSTIRANAAPTGGGIHNSGVVFSSNSTLSANIGGAVAASGGYTRLRFSTVTDNDGGGLTGTVDQIRLQGSVVANQASGPDCSGPVITESHNADSDDTCQLRGPGDLPDASLMLGPLGAPDPSQFPGHELLTPSPLHNAVPVGVLGCGTDVTTDQFARPRPRGPACEIGAIETVQLTPTGFCGFDGIVQTVVIHEGHAYVGGEFARAASSGATMATRPGLARCRPDGTIDSGFEPGIGRQVNAVAIHQNWLYVGGAFDKTVSGTRFVGAARIDLDTGLLDPTWHPDVNGSVQALAVDSSGVYVGGNITHLEGQPVSRLVKLHPVTGARMTAFAVTVDHSLGWENVLSLHLHSTGDLFVGGTFDTINTAARASAARLDSHSGAVKPFSPTITDTNPNDPKVQVEAMVEHQGQIYLCGDWWETEGVGGQDDQRNVGRFDPSTGAADQGWMPAVNRGLQACAISPTGDSLLVAGDHNVVNGQPVGAVQVLDLVTGLVDTSWLPAPTTNVGVKTIAVAPDAIILGGDIAAASGTAVDNAARYVYE